MIFGGFVIALSFAFEFNKYELHGRIDLTIKDII